MDTGPLRPLSEPEKYALEKWRKAGLDRQDIFILILSVIFLLGMIMLGIKVVGNPLQGMHEDRPAMRHGPEQRLARLSAQLKLTDDQKAKIRPILEDEHKQFLALRQDSSLAPRERRARTQEIRARTFDRMQPILTQDQQTKLQQIREKEKERMSRRPRREHGEPGTMNP